jgi:hypothetical protein
MCTWRLTVLQALEAQRVQIMFAYHDEEFPSDTESEIALYDQADEAGTAIS